MQLLAARLCLDCQEIHESQMCPVCGSESFAYISRWVPAPEGRPQRRPVESGPPAPQVEAYRQLLAPIPIEPKTTRWVKRGLIGLAAMSAAAWALKGKDHGETEDAHKTRK